MLEDFELGHIGTHQDGDVRDALGLNMLEFVDVRDTTSAAGLLACRFGHRTGASEYMPIRLWKHMSIAE